MIRLIIIKLFWLLSSPVLIFFACVVPWLCGCKLYKADETPTHVTNAQRKYNTCCDWTPTTDPFWSAEEIFDPGGMAQQWCVVVLLL